MNFCLLLDPSARRFADRPAVGHGGAGRTAGAGCGAFMGGKVLRRELRDRLSQGSAADV